jgi:hypothetical protein
VTDQDKTPEVGPRRIPEDRDLHRKYDALSLEQKELLDREARAGGDRMARAKGLTPDGPAGMFDCEAARARTWLWRRLVDELQIAPRFNPPADEPRAYKDEPWTEGRE